MTVSGGPDCKVASHGHLLKRLKPKRSNLEFGDTYWPLSGNIHLANHP